MGLSILIAVRQQRLALYINPVSPSKETFRVPISIAEAPNCRSSCASSSSIPKRVFATILKFFVISDARKGR